MQHNEHCARGQAHAERARTKSTAGANQPDSALAALKVGIADRHIGKVSGVLKHLGDASTDEADAVVVGLLPLVAAANEQADLDLLRKAMTHEPLGAKALARAVLACLRKDATDGTYGLALSLLDLAPKVHRQALAYELKSLLRTTAVEQDVLERFWADCLFEEAGPLAATT